MKGVAWCLLYNAHKDKNVQPMAMQMQMKEMLANEEIKGKSGIYEYLFTGNVKCLNLRKFSNSDKETMYHQQDGKCALCGGSFELKEMEADHKKPWSKGGKTELKNGQMLCYQCNHQKLAKYSKPQNSNS